MAKINTMVTLDPLLKIEAQKRGLNLSETLEKAINTIICSPNKAGEIDLLVSKAKIKELREKINELTIQLDTEVHKVDQYEIQQKEAKMRELEKAKEEAEKAKYCIQCGQQLQNKYHKFPAGNVCNGCFMTSNKDILTNWNQKPADGPAEA